MSFFFLPDYYIKNNNNYPYITIQKVFSPYITLILFYEFVWSCGCITRIHFVLKPLHIVKNNNNKGHLGHTLCMPATHCQWAAIVWTTRFKGIFPFSFQKYPVGRHLQTISKIIFSFQNSHPY